MNTILVVEDHEEFAEVMNDLLAVLQPQARILNARNGQEGLNLALAEKPDLIFLDIQLPVMDGYEMAQALREASPEALPPIVLMTNARDTGLTIMRMSHLSRGVLRKPFTLDELEEALQQALNK